MNDTLAAEWYLSQASQITLSLEHHWSEAKGYIVSGLKNAQDIRSGLDISTILGVLHSSNLPSLGPDDDRVLSTFVHLVERFAKSFDVNRVTHDSDGHPLGVAVGRYPEDVYDGTGVSNGNPWYLATASLAEFLYKLANVYQKEGRIVITARSLPFFRDFLKLKSIEIDYLSANSITFSAVIKTCKIRGDEFLRRIKYYSPIANLSEQYDSFSGINLGAKDLTWSYASLLSAHRARNYLL
jgi:glucoamylase